MTTRTAARLGRRGAAVLLAVVVAAVPVACGDTDELSLCTQYEQLLATEAELQAIDPEDQTAAEATELVDDYLADVRQVREAADGRYGAALDALEAATVDLLRTLESVEDTAEYSTWAPLVEDSLEDVRNASVTVHEQIEPSCPQNQ